MPCDSCLLRLGATPAFLLMAFLEGYADRAVAQESTPEAFIQFMPGSLELVGLEPGSKHKRKIRITNTGNREITLDKATPSCSCVRVDLSPMRLAPGDEVATEITVQVPYSSSIKHTTIRFGIKEGKQNYHSVFFQVAAGAARVTRPLLVPAVLDIDVSVNREINAEIDIYAPGAGAAGLTAHAPEWLSVTVHPESATHAALIVNGRYPAGYIVDESDKIIIQGLLSSGKEMYVPIRTSGSSQHAGGCALVARIDLPNTQIVISCVGEGQQETVLFATVRRNGSRLAIEVATKSDDKTKRVIGTEPDVLAINSIAYGNIDLLRDINGRRVLSYFLVLQ